MKGYNNTGCESQFILSPLRVREYWVEMARAVCMEIYRSENDRVERQTGLLHWRNVCIAMLFVLFSATNA